MHLTIIGATGLPLFKLSKGGTVTEVDVNGDVETDQRWPSSYAEVTNKNTGTRIRTRTAADTAFPEWEEMLEIPVMSPEDVITVCLVDEYLEDVLTPPAVAAAEATASGKSGALQFHSAALSFQRHNSV